MPLSPSSKTLNKPPGENKPQFARPFFFSRFLSRHTQRTQRERDYSLSQQAVVVLACEYPKIASLADSLFAACLFDSKVSVFADYDWSYWHIITFLSLIQTAKYFWPLGRTFLPAMKFRIKSLTWITRQVELRFLFVADHSMLLVSVKLILLLLFPLRCCAAKTLC